MTKEGAKTTGEQPLFDAPEAGTQDVMLPESPDMGSSEALVPMEVDESYVTALENAAEYAPRIEAALRKILVTIAYPGDWSNHGKTACLSSAGAERALKHFRISFCKWTREKMEWKDDLGSAYRWIYRAECHYKGRAILCEGRYGSRSKFLCKVGGEFKKLEEIDEGDIMAAARHICQGEGIKTMLGLRGIPTEELIRLGVPKDKIADAGYGEGSQGGSTDDESKQRSEVRGMLLMICNNDENEAKKMLVELTTYVTKKDGFGRKKGDTVPGVQSVDKLRGVPLKIALDKATKKLAEWEADQGGGE